MKGRDMDRKSSIHENQKRFDVMFEKYVEGVIPIDTIIEEFGMLLISSRDAIEETKQDILSEKDKEFNRILKRISRKAVKAVKSLK